MIMINHADQGASAGTTGSGGLPISELRTYGDVAAFQASVTHSSS